MSTTVCVHDWPFTASSANSARKTATASPPARGAQNTNRAETEFMIHLSEVMNLVSRIPTAGVVKEWCAGREIKLSQAITGSATEEHRRTGNTPRTDMGRIAPNNFESVFTGVPLRRLSVFSKAGPASNLHIRIKLTVFGELMMPPTHDSGDHDRHMAVLPRQTEASRILRLALIGLTGGVLGSLAMNVYSRAVRSANDGQEATGAAPGSDRDGRGMQPSQAEGRAGQDAAVRVGAAAYRTVIGGEPDTATERRLGTLAHYAFGASAGAIYAVASDNLPALRKGLAIRTS